MFPHGVYELHEYKLILDVDRGNFLIRTPELSGNPTSKIIWKQAGGMDEGNDEFGLAKYFCSYLQAISLHV
jgi:hypothetical protein